MTSRPIPPRLFASVDEAWAHFETNVLGSSSKPITPGFRAHTRDTFYGGAFALLGVLLRQAEHSENLEAIIMRICRDLGLMPTRDAGDRRTM